MAASNITIASIIADLKRHNNKLEIYIGHAHKVIKLFQDEKKKIKEKGNLESDKIKLIDESITAIKIALQDVEDIHSKLKLLQTTLTVEKEAQTQLQELHHVIEDLQKKNSFLKKELSNAEKKCKISGLDIADLDCQVQQLTFINTLPFAEGCLYSIDETPDATPSAAPSDDETPDATPSAAPSDDETPDATPSVAPSNDETPDAKEVHGEKKKK